MIGRCKILNDYYLLDFEEKGNKHRMLGHRD